MRFSIDDAAKLAEASYTPDNITSPQLLRSMPPGDVRAHVLQGGIVLIPGSDSVADYLKFNLRVLRLGHRELRMDDNKQEAGASGTVWHQGFLAYASEIFHWLLKENINPRFVIGHSLGAAAAQILAKTYDIPGIAFAAPRPKFARNRVIRDRNCLLINRSDDPVPDLPLSFFHLGTVRKISRQSGGPRVAHSMKHYREIVAQGLQQQKLPTHWEGG